MRSILAEGKSFWYGEIYLWMCRGLESIHGAKIMRFGASRDSGVVGLCGGVYRDIIELSGMKPSSGLPVAPSVA
jgi:hypothetical protein